MFVICVFQADPKGYIANALGNARPSDLTVRELLQISRKMLKKKKKPRKKKDLLEDEEFSEYDDDMETDEVSSDAFVFLAEHI